jgi:hypothetical protein
MAHRSFASPLANHRSRWLFLWAGLSIALAACGSDDALVDRTGTSDTAAISDSAGQDTAQPPVDAGDAKDSSSGDTAQACPGGPGCTCKADKDCPGSACLPTKAGKRCSPACNPNGLCSPGNLCKSVVASDGKTYKLCVERFARLCQACTESLVCKTYAEQASHCVAASADKGASGFFCANVCDSTDQCPSGYNCAETPSIEGGLNEKHCIPADGLCPCNALAIADGAQTTCSKTAKDAGGASIGVCKGKRVCEKTGLSDCSAKLPAVETCNGIDDDCDASTDEQMGCDDKDACTIDSCGAADGCKHIPLGKQCDDGNLCTTDACDPKTGCTHSNHSDPCDDGSACTSADACTLGKCLGTPVNCDDKNPCTDQTCKTATGCLVVDNADPCQDGNACTTGDKCKSAQCVGSGALACDDKNPCTKDFCEPAVGCTATAADGGSCNDNNTCTEKDVCKGGSCAGAPLNCDDGNPCTLDTCDPVKLCTHSPGPSAPCDDGNLCTTNDTCAAGSCQPGQEKICADTNPCTMESCVPSSGKCNNQMVADSTPCDDGTACTHSDQCLSASCTGTPISCDDQNPCTENTCDKVDGCKTKLLTGTTCDDKLECTGNGSCKNGLCSAGSAVPAGTPCSGGKTCDGVLCK